MYSAIPSLLIFFLSTIALGKELKLFTWYGAQVRSYDSIVRSIGPGTVLDMGDGHKFTVVQRLGQGSTTLVFDIGEGKALRVPSTSKTRVARFLGMSLGRAVPSEMINSYLDGYQEFLRYHAPVTRVFTELSHRGRYIVVEKLNVHFTLKDFLQDGTVQPSGEERLRIENELVEFVVGFWAFRRIGDCGLHQVAYTDRGWVLMDWTHQHQLVASNFPDENYFRFSKYGDHAYAENFATRTYARNLVPRISERIFEERNRNRKLLPYSCSELLLGGLVRSFTD